MRRAVPVLTACLLFGATACGTAKNGNQAADQPPVPPAASVPAVGDTAKPAGETASEQGQMKQVCEAVGQVYTENMGRFAGSLSSMVADRPDKAKAKTSQERAQQALGQFGKDVLNATQYSPAEARTAGKKAADQLNKVAGDDAFFTKVKTAADVDKVLATDLTAWLKPITDQCS